MILAGRRVVLGVSGGIACYKTCTVARRLTEAGADVDVVLTASGARFVQPVTFEALTGRTVYTSLWEPGAALAHVSLGQEADLLILAPATAHLIARAAQGLADDFLTTLVLAATAPVLIAPAMNDRMFAHPATQKNLKRLTERGWVSVGPAVGPLAEGPSEQPGRMSEPEEILAVAERMIRGRKGALLGKRVMVTAGPTVEELDPVRVLTNRSSGKMGYRIAEAAYARGADVLLITGSTNLPPPYGVRVVYVESTEDLRIAVAEELSCTDLLVMAAAPADFGIGQAAPEKVPRASGAVDVRLEPTVDILESTKDQRKRGSIIVGFALETGDGLEKARQKLERKGLDFIVLNMANEDGAGFDVETNRVTLISRHETTELPLISKRAVAERILDAAEKLL